MKQALGSRHGHQGRYLSAAAGMPKNRDPRGVTAKLRDIVAHPLQCQYEIQHAHVPRLGKGLPTDRRQIKLSLTPKGQAMTRRVRLKAAEKYVNSIKKLSPADRQKMVEGIAVMFDVIEQTRKEMSNGMAE